MLELKSECLIVKGPASRYVRPLVKPSEVVGQSIGVIVGKEAMTKLLKHTDFRKLNLWLMLNCCDRYDDLQAAFAWADLALELDVATHVGSGHFEEDPVADILSNPPFGSPLRKPNLCRKLYVTALWKTITGTLQLICWNVNHSSKMPCALHTWLSFPPSTVAWSAVPCRPYAAPPVPYWRAGELHQLLHHGAFGRSETDQLGAQG